MKNIIGGNGDSGQKLRRVAGSHPGLMSIIRQYAERELRIPPRYSTQRWLGSPQGWCTCSVSSPRPCPTPFTVSGRPARFTSPAGNSTPASRSRWPATRRTDADGATAGLALLSSRLRCCCMPPTGLAPSLTTKRSSGRSSRVCRRRTSRWRCPPSATGLPRGPYDERAPPRSDAAVPTRIAASDAVFRPSRTWTAGAANRYRHGHCGTRGALHTVACGSLTPESTVQG